MDRDISDYRNWAGELWLKKKKEKKEKKRRKQGEMEMSDGGLNIRGRMSEWTSGATKREKDVVIARWLPLFRKSKRKNNEVWALAARSDVE